MWSYHCESAHQGSAIDVHPQTRWAVSAVSFVLRECYLAVCA